jgi:hypothetical protein
METLRRRVDNREINREFFFAVREKPHGLRVFAILMHENRELTGNLVIQGSSVRSLDFPPQQAKTGLPGTPVRSRLLNDSN